MSWPQILLRENTTHMGLRKDTWNLARWAPPLSEILPVASVWPVLKAEEGQRIQGLDQGPQASTPAQG